MVKDYFKRVYKDVSKAELIYWWSLRLLMIGGIIYSLVKEGLSSYNPPQMAANLVGMLAYEICQMFPKKTFPRFFSHKFQNLSILVFFLASFGGAFLNFYYSVPCYDKVLHALGCAVGVYVSYEAVCAMQIRDKSVCAPNIAAIAAMGLAFAFASGWEIFEFSFDQWFGGDAQHWDLQKAIAEAGSVDKVFMIIPLDEARFESRFALMDTMVDTILNCIGAIGMYIFLRINPYRHKGTNNINKIIEEELVKNAKENSQA
ncbi:MAG: hypothetical protein IJ025_07655 [Clostridia bacterium]|nr:hypothetical protein [Clostridia bacterium]